MSDKESDAHRRDRQSDQRWRKKALAELAIEAAQRPRLSLCGIIKSATDGLYDGIDSGISDRQLVLAIRGERAALRKLDRVFEASARAALR